MDKKEALEILKTHTQYFVPSADFKALDIAIEALEEQIGKDEIQEKMINTK